LPPTAKGLHPAVLDPGLLQGRSQGLLVEVRERLGTGESPDVRQSLDPVLCQQAEELASGRLEWPMVKTGSDMASFPLRSL